MAIFESGRAEGRAYFSMEHFPDGDLARRLRERAFAPREAAVLMQKIAAAVAFAHREGVLHRDLKPSNVLLDGDDPRIADFGLASLLHEAGDLTVHTTILGTPGYLAPEGFTVGFRGAGRSRRHLRAGGDVLRAAHGPRALRRCEMPPSCPRSWPRGSRFRRAC